MLRNAPSDGPRGRLIGMDVPAIFNQVSNTSTHDKNFGFQNYAENHYEFDNVIYALELGARKLRRFGGRFSCPEI